MTESDKTLRDEVVELADRIHRLSESTGIIERAAAHEYAVRQLRGILARHPVTQPADVIPWGQYPDAKWAFKLSDNRIFLTAIKPGFDDRSWNLPWRFWEASSAHDAHIPGPWRDSLRKRPEGV